MSKEQTKRYFEAVVVISTQSENSKGELKIKKQKETYLVDAMSITEAEARIVETCTTIGGINDFSVFSVKESKIIEVIEYKPAKKTGL